MLVCDLFLNTFADSIRSSMAPSDKPYIYIRTIWVGGWEKWERDGLSQPIFHFGYMAGVDFYRNKYSFYINL